jgi:hypothetical protein
MSGSANNTRLNLFIGHSQHANGRTDRFKMRRQHWSRHARCPLRDQYTTCLRNRKGDDCFLLMRAARGNRSARWQTAQNAAEPNAQNGVCRMVSLSR